MPKPGEEGSVETGVLVGCCPLVGAVGACAPGGEQLWRATFDERQQALSENVFNAARYPGRGSRWLSAGELARWGAEEVAQVMPVGGS